MDKLQQSRRPARRPVGAAGAARQGPCTPAPIASNSRRRRSRAAVRAFVLALIAHVLLDAGPDLGHQLEPRIARTSRPRPNSGPACRSRPRPRSRPRSSRRHRCRPAASTAACPRSSPRPPPPVPQAKPDIALEQREEAAGTGRSASRRSWNARRSSRRRKKREELEREKKLEARKKRGRARSASSSSREEGRRGKQEEGRAGEGSEGQGRSRPTRSGQRCARTIWSACRPWPAHRRPHRDRHRQCAQPALRTATPAASARACGPTSSSPDDVAGNPDGRSRGADWRPTAPSRASGSSSPAACKSWDEAVLRALDKTEVLPRDVDGRVHSPLIIEFSRRAEPLAAVLAACAHPDQPACRDRKPAMTITLVDDLRLPWSACAIQLASAASLGKNFASSPSCSSAIGRRRAAPRAARPGPAPARPAPTSPACGGNSRTSRRDVGRLAVDGHAQELAEAAARRRQVPDLVDVQAKAAREAVRLQPRHHDDQFVVLEQVAVGVDHGLVRGGLDRAATCRRA